MFHIDFITHTSKVILKGKGSTKITVKSYNTITTSTNSFVELMESFVICSFGRKILRQWFHCFTDFNFPIKRPLMVSFFYQLQINTEN